LEGIATVLALPGGGTVPRIEVVDLVWKGLRQEHDFTVPVSDVFIEVVDLVWKGLRRF